MKVSRRAFIAASPFPVLSMQRSRRSVKPNLVLILAEELSAWLLGCFGNKEIKTPNLDLLARSGTRFISHTVATAAAPGNRATFLTGRLPHQHGCEDGPSERLVSELLLSDLLAKAGYECAYAGRWDLGGELKPQHGFSQWFPLAGGETGFTAEWVTARAVDFLEKQSPGRPFFLVAAYPLPAAPYAGLPSRFYDLYSGVAFETAGWQPASASASRGKELLADTVDSLRRLAAAVTALDEQVKPLLAVLDRRSLRDNTLVVFTACRGVLAGRHGLWHGGDGSEPPNLYTEALETPMIWNWPGTVPVEGARTELVASYDLFPSLCAALEVTPPPKANLCGRSFLLPVTNQPLPRKAPWRNLVFASYRNTEMVRDSRFKLVLRSNGAGPNELYDLRADAAERFNQYDNAEFITVRKTLEQQLRQWRTKYA